MRKIERNGGSKNLLRRNLCKKMISFIRHDVRGARDLVSQRNH